MIDNFPGNSHRSDRERSEVPSSEVDKKIEAVVVGKVVRRKKSLGRRFMDTFFSGDTNSVFGFIWRDVLVPALQATATDVVTQGIQKAVYGETRPSSQRSFRPSSPGRTHISYDRFNPTSRTPSPTPSARRPSRPSAFQMGEIILERRIEADTVLERLMEIVEEYGAVSVADLNGLIGQTSQYTDHKWGWDNLNGSEVRAIREGFLLVLPEPEDLR